jgi:ribosomal protein S18 acetylase RimI-like enzyme
VTDTDGVRSIVVRLYQRADQAKVRALHDRTPPAGNPLTKPQPWPSDLDEIQRAYLAFWVAVERDDTGERVVGITGIEPAGSDVPAAVLRGRSGVARLKRMRVAPERQRQGIGTKLTRAAIAWGRERGFSRLILETTPEQTAAIRLYQRMGFAEVGRSKLGDFELVWFELPLNEPAAAAP